MKILVANHWLEKPGGSETFTYTLVGELVRQGHDVDLFTHRPGMVSRKIESHFKVKSRLQPKYDLILANHNTCVEYLHSRGFLIQTCHGIFPKLEMPSRKANFHVGISEEVCIHLKSLGYKSELILNGIDLDRFNIHSRPYDRPQLVLSLVHSDVANRIVKDACDIAGCGFTSINKYKNPVWNIEDMINKADVVISLGRGAYESFACGRSVVVYDARKYFESLGDGYINPSNIHESIKNNCSGRRFRFRFDPDLLSEEILKHHVTNASYLRWYAEQNLDISAQVKKYLNLYERLN